MSNTAMSDDRSQSIGSTTRSGKKRGLEDEQERSPEAQQRSENYKIAATQTSKEQNQSGNNSSRKASPFSSTDAEASALITPALEHSLKPQNNNVHETIFNNSSSTASSVKH
jgi:hypothetical protein